MVFQVPARALKTTFDPQKSGSFHRQGQAGHPGLKGSLAVVKGNCRTHTKIQMSKCRGRTNLPVHRQLPANPEPALQTCLNPSIVITQPLLDCSIRDEDFVLSRLHNRWQKGNPVLLKPKNLDGVVSILAKQKPSESNV